MICEPIWTLTPAAFRWREAAPCAVEFRSLAHRHAELVFMQAGGNVRMGAGIHVGIHAYREASLLTKMSGAGVQQM